MIAAFWALALAYADDRDDELFGGGETTPPPPEETEPTPEAGDMLSDEEIQARLGAKEQELAIGGQIYTRVDAFLQEDQDVGEANLAVPALFDLFIDARPTDRLRAYARGRLRRDFAVQEGDTDDFGNEKEPTSVLLDQLWLKGDIARRVFLTGGQQRIKWGAGHFWNPTDFLNQQVRDPLAAFDERTGVPLVKVHVPFERLGANVYALVSVDGASSPEEIGGAVRAEWAAGRTELTASAAARKDQPLRLGADVSSGIGPFDVFVEGAVQHGVEASFWEGSLDIEEFVFPTEVDRSEDWIPEVVVGAQVSVRYSDEDSLTVGVEAFYNDAGYDDDELYAWLFAMGQATPLYLGRAYGGAFLMLLGPGQWDHTSFIVSGLSNLSDRTSIARFDARATVLTRLDLNGYVAAHMGEQGGEFRFAVDIPPSSLDPALENGISIAAPLVDVGAGATVRF